MFVISVHLRASYGGRRDCNGERVELGRLPATALPSISQRQRLLKLRNGLLKPPAVDSAGGFVFRHFVLRSRWDLVFIMPLKILVFIFAVAVILRTWARRSRGDLSSREATAWTVLWILVFAAVLNPHATDVVARWFGVGRGADLLIFISVVALFALVSWLLSRVEKIEREITTVVRETALGHGELGIKNKELGNRNGPNNTIHNS